MPKRIASRTIRINLITHESQPLATTPFERNNSLPCAQGARGSLAAMLVRAQQLPPLRLRGAGEGRGGGESAKPHVSRGFATQLDRRSEPYDESISTQCRIRNRSVSVSPLS
jgi:hypothetical protein